MHGGVHASLKDAGSGLMRASNTARAWRTYSLADRLGILRAARHSMAEDAAGFIAAISPHLARTRADTLVSELLPLLDACKFLEREAEGILAPRRPGRRGRPLWLWGVLAEVHREPLGHVLVIAPANFPLFLPGVQVLQALAAGNTVTWKPGHGGSAIAHRVLQHLRAAGLPAGVLDVTDESIEASRKALEAKPDKVIFTGSSGSGASILRHLADDLIPATVELSGADAIVVMDGADLQRAASIVAFGLRLNGAAVCMSPRRLFASRNTMARLKPLLSAALADVPAVTLDARSAESLRHALYEAVDAGASLLGSLDPQAQRPLILDRATPIMDITRMDLFAPVISLLEVESLEVLHDAYSQCPYALTVSILCGKSEEKAARALGTRLKAGTVLINDAIAPTANPRLPFGGRGASGYGVTRGEEGLLEMTAIKSLIVRKSGSMRHLEPTSDNDVPMFTGLIASMHGKGVTRRCRALIDVLRSVRH
jgi:acyl-CoA reductase-like NAD-dependent aldehyde dehydrogenase